MVRPFHELFGVNTYVSNEITKLLCTIVFEKVPNDSITYATASSALVLGICLGKFIMTTEF
jgi:hypothetical protein